MASLSVSVAMATYNGAAYLARQLDDLAAQSILPAELVICDDGSTDNTLAILERFAITAPFAVRAHRNSDVWATARTSSNARACVDPT